MRLQLALDVTDLDAAVDFYASLFDTEPAKRKPGYANFAIDEPPLKLVLFEGARDGAINHLGVETETADEVRRAADRLDTAGLDPTTVAETTCCHADKIETWVHGPDGTRWEWYVKTADVEVGDPPESSSSASLPMASVTDSAGLPAVADEGFACDLDAAQLPERLEQAGRLRTHLRDVVRDDHGVTLHVEPTGRDEVEAFVRAESQCCSFFRFDQRDVDDEVTLQVSAPDDATHLLDQLHEALETGDPGAWPV